MNFSKTAQQLAVQSSLCLLLSACQSYEPFTEEEVFRGSYERNFKQVFGVTNPAQSWDFSDYIPDSAVKATRSEVYKYELFANPKKYYEVDETLYNQILNSNQDNTKGESFALLIEPGDCFEIIPLYLLLQNEGKIEWIFQVFVDDENVAASQYNSEGWVMGTDFLVKSKADGDYAFISQTGGCSPYGNRCYPVVQYQNQDRCQKLMYLNLLVKSVYYTSSHIYDKYVAVGSQQSSLNHQMRILENIPRPDNIDERYETMFIACEAANFDPAVPFKLNEGNRYQNLVFMVVGPKLPKVVYPEVVGQDELSFNKSVSSKRYMIEDLGSTSDFDFNDIVVDVNQHERVIVELTQERASETKPIKTTVSTTSSGEIRTEAIVQHLCGTKPFQLTVGDYTFGKVTDPTNLEQTIAQLQHQAVENSKEFEIPEPVEGCDPKVSAIISDWNPAENKVSVTVWRRGEDDRKAGGWTASFPLDGEVPYIMALPIAQPWTAEGQRFDDWKKYVFHSTSELK